MIVCNTSRWPRQGLKEGLDAIATQEHSSEAPACAKDLKQSSRPVLGTERKAVWLKHRSKARTETTAEGQGGRTTHALAATLTVLIPRIVESR